jgi:hypothetical protein
MSGDNPAVLYWRGQRVEEMTRHEAIAALKECAALLKQAEVGEVDRIRILDYTPPKTEKLFNEQ